MRALLGTIGLLVALALAPAGAGGATATPSDARLAAVGSWAFAIGTGTLRGDLSRRYADYDLLVLDGEEAGRRRIAELRAEGKLVLGYLSVGTIETYRSWYRRLKPYRLQAWKDWKGEFYARVRSRGFRREVAGRIAPALLAKGFDGLFLDNVDMIESHRSQAGGMRLLIARLGALAKDRGALLFAQNGYDVIDPFLPYLDGWNREDVTGTFDFDRGRYVTLPRRRVARNQRELRAVAARGLLVTATDYTRRRRGAAVRRAVRNACAAGALPYVSDIDLRRTPRRAQRCR